MSNSNETHIVDTENHDDVEIDINDLDPKDTDHKNTHSRNIYSLQDLKDLNQDPNNPEQEANSINGWTPDNLHTVMDWKITTSRASFISDIVLEKYRKKTNIILLIALAISSAATIISAVSTALLGTKDTGYQNVTLGINIAILVLNGINSFLHGIITTVGWDDLILKLSNYIQKLDIFYATIASELILPETFRQNGDNFIKEQSKDYLNIMIHSPNISTSDYDYAHHLYIDFVNNKSNQFKPIQKFGINNYGESKKDV